MDRYAYAHLKRENAQGVFEKLNQRYKIFAPVEIKGRGRFSDTALLTYGEAKSFDEIDFFKKTSFSAKSILLPVRETILSFKDKKIEEPHVELSLTAVFLRSCDIHALSVLDAHFLGEGYVDPYYKRRREKIKIFLIECPESFENCYCVSLRTNTTDNYAVFMRKNEDGYEAIIKDKEFAEYFPLTNAVIREPQFAQSNPSLRIPEEIEPSIFKDEMWKEYSQRCIGCGRCTVSCPTCACFTFQDIIAEDGASQRKRIWSSCQAKKFSLLAGNHDFRIPTGDRMRYRVLHKIRDFRKRRGLNMCVGCGRCEDVCPEYIGMAKCVEKINEIGALKKK